MSFTQTWFRFQYEFLYLESTQTGKYLLTSVSVWKVPIVVHFLDEMKHFFYIYHFLSIKEQSWDLQTNHHNCNMKVKVLTSSFFSWARKIRKFHKNAGLVTTDQSLFENVCGSESWSQNSLYFRISWLSMNHTSLRSSI